MAESRLRRALGFRASQSRAPGVVQELGDEAFDLSYEEADGDGGLPDPESGSPLGEHPMASPGPERDPEASEVKTETDGRAEWGFEAGEQIAEGRTAVRSLGGGSRFEVYLVWDDHLFSLAAAKMVRPELVEKEAVLRELREEAEVLERLAHPVIVRSFDTVLEGARPHVLIEHLEGPTLRRLIRRHGSLPLEQLLPLAAHIAAALHYMAAEEMVHLDVKPDNLVMSVPPRLIDMSIARTFEHAARLRGSIGTDAYMPPEQCDASAHPGMVGPASDVFGLGATLYHAIAGAVPFPRPREARDSEDRLVRFPQLVEAPQPLPSGTPESLHDLVLRMLAKAPDERPSAADVVLGLEPLVAALPRRLALARRNTRMRF